MVWVSDGHPGSNDRSKRDPIVIDRDRSHRSYWFWFVIADRSLDHFMLQKRGSRSRSIISNLETWSIISWFVIDQFIIWWSITSRFGDRSRDLCMDYRSSRSIVVIHSDRSRRSIKTSANIYFSYLNVWSITIAQLSCPCVQWINQTGRRRRLRKSLRCCHRRSVYYAREIILPIFFIGVFKVLISFNWEFESLITSLCSSIQKNIRL